MWQSWEVAFAQNTKDCERPSITRLHNCRKIHYSTLEFLKKFKGICNKLAAIQKPVSDDDKVSWLGISFSSKYMKFVNS